MATFLCFRSVFEEAMLLAPVLKEAIYIVPSREQPTKVGTVYQKAQLLGSSSRGLPMVHMMDLPMVQMMDQLM